MCELYLDCYDYNSHGLQSTYDRAAWDTEADKKHTHTHKCHLIKFFNTLSKKLSKGPDLPLKI